MRSNPRCEARAELLERGGRPRSARPRSRAAARAAPAAPAPSCASCSRAGRGGRANRRWSRWPATRTRASACARLTPSAAPTERRPRRRQQQLGDRGALFWSGKGFAKTHTDNGSAMQRVMTLCQKTSRMQKAKRHADTVAQPGQLVGDIIFLRLVVQYFSRWTLALPGFPSLVDTKDPLLRQVEPPTKVPRPRSVTCMLIIFMLWPTVK